MKRLIVWATITFIIAATFTALLVRKAQCEVCRASVDATVEKRAGYKWQYRTVDGRKCWYYSNSIIDRNDLVWSYTEQDFNSDIERVIERKFYLPDWTVRPEQPE